MAQDDASIKRYLVALVGETDDNRLSSNVDFLWDRYGERGYVYPGLQEQYVLRALVQMAQGYERTRTQMGTKRHDEVFAHLVTLHDQAQKEIERLEARARANIAPVQGQLITVQPQTPPGTPGQEPWLNPPQTVFPDTLNPIYRGDPYQPTEADSAAHGVGF